jgi:hypothetical protein
MEVLPITIFPEAKQLPSNHLNIDHQNQFEFISDDFDSFL